MLINGSFETGDFTGWTTAITGSSRDPWVVTGETSGPRGVVGPRDGDFVAWNGFEGTAKMEFHLYQDVVIPAGATATFSWMDRIQWFFGNSATLPRLYNVEIRDPTTHAVLQNVFSFSTGDPETNWIGDTRWLSHSVDLSAHAGQTVRIFFREQIPEFLTGDAQIEFDAISLTVDQTPGQPSPIDVDEYQLDLTGRAGQAIDVVLAADFEVAPAGEGQFSESQEAQGVVAAQNLLEFHFTSLPNPAGHAILRVDAIATLETTFGYLTLDAEGLFTRELFVADGQNQQLVSTAVVIPLPILRQLMSDGTASFSVIPSFSVYVPPNSPNSLTLNLTYETLAHPAASLQLLDSGGNDVLASGVGFNDKLDLGILGFVVPRDDVYTLRVAADQVGGYQIVVTDDLLFEAEPVEPVAGDLRSLDAYAGALGYLGDRPSDGINLSLGRSFEGFSPPQDSSLVPADPSLAAGPQSVVAMASTNIAIYDKTTGATLADADLDGAGGFWATNNAVFDPWIVFDPHSRRFFAVGVDRNSAAGGSSRVYLAVSTDATPANLTTDWNKYIIDRTGTNRQTGESTFPDDPKLGVNQDAIYITADEKGISSDNFAHASLFAIEKAPLLSGGAANIVHEEVIGFGGRSVYPVINYDAGPTMYFAEAAGFGGIRIHTLLDVLTAPQRRTSTVRVPRFYSPRHVPQLDGPLINPLDDRLMSGVVRDGRLWTAHAVSRLNFFAKTTVRWYEVTVGDFASSTSLFVQSGNIDPGLDVHAWMPHINVDSDGNMGIGFSLSGPTMYASIGYTGRQASDPRGVTRPVEIARAGQGPFERRDEFGRNLWGGYPGLAIDPDEETFWLYNAYAKADNNWGTFAGAFRVADQPPPADVDAYSVTLEAGETISLRTTTPFDDPLDALNRADPNLELIDLHGQSVAFDSDSAADGKNASIASFTAASSGVYKVLVGTDSPGTGEYVLSLNRAPVLESFALSSQSIFENEAVSLLGSFSDQDRDDSHELVVNWDDPNDPVDSTFSLPSVDALTVGDVIASTTDDALLEITALDLATRIVSFAVVEHQYLDDGVAPGNEVPSDTSTVRVTVTDGDGLSSAPPAAEFIGNGDFETGDFSGWALGDRSGGSWDANGGELIPYGPGRAMGPISGSFDAVTSQYAPGIEALTQPIAVPLHVSSATLSWSDRVRNHGARFMDSVQEFRVLLRNASGELIQELFSTDSDQASRQLGPNRRRFDLTSLFQTLAGQTVQLSFEVQATLYFHNVSLDDVSLRISSEAGMDLLINNVGPQIVSPSVVVGKQDDSVTLSAEFTDVGTLDRHTVVIDWGDNSTTNSNLNPSDFPAFVDSVDGGVGSFTATHAYATGGIFTVTVTVIDDDTGQATTSTQVVAPGVRLTRDGVLQIIGTDNRDRTTITRTGDRLWVLANFLDGANFETFDIDDVSKIVAHLFDGDDHFIISGSVAVPAIVHGGAGRDLLKAGGGSTVLLGDEGNDRLFGGRNRDILIGGIGADVLLGGLGEDLLVAGNTTHDNNDQALMDLLVEWNGNDSYSVRVDRLRTATGTSGIKLTQVETVFDDSASDRLLGSAGSDWFFFDLVKDLALDRRNGEERN